MDGDVDSIMMRFKIFPVLALILTNALTTIGLAAEPDDNCGIIYGDHHAFSVCAPQGWVLDNTTGLRFGLHAIFYPKGSTWEKSDVVMYMNWAPKSKAIQNIKSLVDSNLSRFKKEGSPNVKAEFIKSIQTQKQKEGRIWEFTGNKWGAKERVCYFEEQHGIAIAVLSATHSSAFEGAKKAFASLYESYFFISENVQFE